MAAKIDRLVLNIRFAATYADRAEAKAELVALVGKDEAIRLIYEVA